jgi:hypothetical protein
MSSFRSFTAGVCLLAFAAPAWAGESGDSARIARLEQQLVDQHEQIARLERMLAEQSALLARLAPPAAAQGAQSQQLAREATRPDALPAPLQSVVPPVHGDFGIAGLDVSGDLRLRQEFNVSDRSARDRARTVLRARLRATYAISDHISVGAQVATGDPDDPNSTDITLSGFDDDLDISLDQAWLRYTNGGLTLYGGKFPQIFARTDMLWDGDVVPEGVGGIYKIGLGKGASLDARAMYFIVDEAAGGPDSYLIGGQAVLSAPLAHDWKASFAAAYYAYHLRSLAGADSGDIRTNLFGNGRYLSHFRLLEGLATVSYSGLGERWPISLTADYVHNFGAVVDADTAFNLELVAGRTTEKGDWRFAYNYSRVEADAVFAAFSQDNIAFGSNYLLHGASIGYAARKNVVFDLNLYHYRLLERFYAGLGGKDDWLDRIRLNVSLLF